MALDNLTDGLYSSGRDTYRAASRVLPYVALPFALMAQGCVEKKVEAPKEDHQLRMSSQIIGEGLGKISENVYTIIDPKFQEYEKLRARQEKRELYKDELERLAQIENPKFKDMYAELNKNKKPEQKKQEDPEEKNIEDFAKMINKPKEEARRLMNDREFNEYFTYNTNRSMGNKLDENQSKRMEYLEKKHPEYKSIIENIPKDPVKDELEIKKKNP